LRLFAPFLPFATEEVWGWWRTGSVHRAQWPAPLDVSDGDTSMLATVGVALSGIRKAKSEAKVKQRTEVLSATVTATESLTTQLRAGLGDLKAAANARELVLVAGEGELTVSDVALAPAEEPAQA
ncbi:MAG: class I tRNA ligase family protein, partial [Arthrobacter sp.]